MKIFAVALCTLVKHFDLCKDIELVLWSQIKDTIHVSQVSKAQLWNNTSSAMVMPLKSLLMATIYKKSHFRFVSSSNIFLSTSTSAMKSTECNDPIFFWLATKTFRLIATYLSFTTIVMASYFVCAIYREMIHNKIK